jgi:hypothetical protein
MISALGGGLTRLTAGGLNLAKAATNYINPVFYYQVHNHHHHHHHTPMVVDDTNTQQDSAIMNLHRDNDHLMEQASQCKAERAQCKAELDKANFEKQTCLKKIEELEEESKILMDERRQLEEKLEDLSMDCYTRASQHLKPVLWGIGCLVLLWIGLTYLTRNRPGEEEKIDDDDNGDGGDKGDKEDDRIAWATSSNITMEDELKEKLLRRKILDKRERRQRSESFRIYLRDIATIQTS